MLEWLRRLLRALFGAPSASRRAPERPAPVEPPVGPAEALPRDGAPPAPASPPTAPPASPHGPAHAAPPSGASPPAPRLDGPNEQGAAPQSPPLAAIEVALTQRLIAGSRYWFAQIDGAEFLVGQAVRYEHRRGLMLSAPAAGYVRYDPAAWRGPYGVWADMIAATAEVEGRGDLCTVNSYDRAGFTFGLMQWAAHTPNDNLVLLLRRLLSLPNARAYFPDLVCDATGRIAKRTAEGSESLESDASTSKLMRYLNPSETEVDEDEARVSAKLIHWIRTDAQARETLVGFAIEHYRNMVKAIARRVPLDGKTDIEVLVCADIRHQGRGGRVAFSRMREALSKTRSVEALLDIGADAYPTRVAGLETMILEGIAAGRFGRHRYDAATAEMRLDAEPGGAAYVAGPAEAAS